MICLSKQLYSSLLLLLFFGRHSTTTTNAFIVTTRPSSSRQQQHGWATSTSSTTNSRIIRKSLPSLPSSSYGHILLRLRSSSQVNHDETISDDTLASFSSTSTQQSSSSSSSLHSQQQKNGPNNTRRRRRRSPRPPKRNFRMKLYSILNLPIVEVIAASAVLLSSFLVALNTLKDLPPQTYELIQDSIIFLNILFAIDFFARWYANGQLKIKYLQKSDAILDIFVVLLPLLLITFIPMLDETGILPSNTLIPTNFNFQDSAGLQVLLLLRVQRLKRVLTDINTFGRFQIALGLKPQDVRPYQLQLARVLLSIFTLLSVSSGLIYLTEHNVNPNIPDYFTALYFGLTTLTTVGFGDIAPVTFNGRLVVSGSILVGVAVIPTQAAKLVDAFMESQSYQEKVQAQPSILKSSPFERRQKKKKELTQASYATNGMGPTGKPIDVPPKEEKIKTKTTTTTSSTIICDRCGATDHRVDALFCYSCGCQFCLRDCVECIE